MNEISETLFSTKMCLENFYLYPYIANPGNSSYDISTEYVIGGNCAYIHQTHYAYCGESNLGECRNCQRQGCTIIECGLDPSYEVRKYVKFRKMKDFYQLHLNQLNLLKCMSYVFLILYQMKRS